MEEASLGITERRTEAELAEALIEEEIRLGRAMSRREVLGFSLGFLAPSYESDSAGAFREILERVPARVGGQGLPMKDDREPAIRSAHHHPRAGRVDDE